MDDPRIEFWWERDFPHKSWPDVSPLSILCNGHRVIPRGRVAGAWRWLPLVPRLKKEYSYTSAPLRAVVADSNLGLHIGYPGWGVSWYFSVRLRKFRADILIKSWPLLSTSSPIQQHWQCRKLNHKTELRLWRKGILLNCSCNSVRS